MAETLSHLFKSCVRLNPEFLSKWKKYKIESKLEFDRSWGLGSSSTLVACLASWADVDPIDLQLITFGGSGYDAVCSSGERPILYQIQEGLPGWNQTDFNPAFVEHLFLVYLGNKQNSRVGIERYNNQKSGTDLFVQSISELTEQMVQATSLDEFESIIENHEVLVSEQLNQQPAKAIHFSDYWGQIKSLGAWGGDFVLVTNDRKEEEAKKYFNEMGYEVFLSYKSMVL